MQSLDSDSQILLVCFSNSCKSCRMTISASIRLSVTCILFRILLTLVSTEGAGVLFSSLERSLVVSATLNNQTSFPVARAGLDQLRVSWSLNKSFGPGIDAPYKKVELKLCFAPESQIDRVWRKINNDLSKDKTCQMDITSQPYQAAGNTTVWTVSEVVPKATYFVRVYAVDGEGSKVAYGQTTDKNKTSNLFKVEPISGRHPSLDIAAIVFSVFSVGALFLFFIVEKKKSRR